MSTVLIKMNTRDPDMLKLREVARSSREGRIVAFPTETVYGIGLPMSIQDAAARLASLKQRSPDKPFAYHIGEWAMVDYLGVKRSAAFRFLTGRFWPGPLSLLVEARNGELIGIRFPRHPVVSVLINSAGEPFLATSANVSGRPSSQSGREVMEQFKDKIDYVIDAGPCEMKKDSTIVSLARPDQPVLVRRGARAAEIEDAVARIRSGRFPRKRILIVCTGNSCRSPMAEGWLRDELKAKDLADVIEVFSCGIGARSGSSPTPEAVFVMKNREIDISGHRARPCSREDVMNADLIIAMSSQHAHFVTGMIPDARNKIVTLSVMDPIGMGMPVYEEVFAVIEKKMTDLWEEIIR